MIIVLLFVFIKSSNGSDRPFNQVVLSENNNIGNTALPTFYDTILSVGLDEVGIQFQSVSISKLSDGAKSQFDGQLKAHLRYFGNFFYLFIDDMDKEEAITVISHEIIHIQQYLNQDLIYEEDQLIWKGEEIDLNSKEYERRPWEIEAFDREGDLASRVTKKLWGDN